jgi:hypothetical protein
MSRYFVTDPPVAVPEFDTSEVVSECAPNIIWIRARMDVATSGKVANELVKVGGDNAPEYHLGAQQVALLIHNIMQWEGPDFDGVPCTPERIRTLDPNEPHIVKVLEEIAERNKPRASPNAKSAGANTSTTNGAPGSIARPPIPTNHENVSLQLATTIPRSPLQNALDGRLSKSGD